MYFAMNSAAVHWVFISADLYEQQILLVVTAVSEAAITLFCTAALSSGKCMLPRIALQCIGFASLQTLTNSKS